MQKLNRGWVGWAVRVLGLLLIVGGATSCSDQAAGHPVAFSVPGPLAGAAGAYSIKVLVQADGEKAPHLLKLGPVGTSALGAPKTSPPSTQTTQSARPGPPGVHPLATIGDGSGTEDTQANDTANNLADGWTLMSWALRTCVRDDNPRTSQLEGTPIPPIGTHGFGIAGAPWALKSPRDLITTYYFFYSTDPFDPRDNCDAALFMQEALLCAADRLSQLSDSPGTVTWSVPPSTNSADTIGDSDNPIGDTPQITDTIPPQDAKDVFIARDMALNALAYVAKLDSRKVTFSVQLTPDSSFHHTRALSCTNA